MMTEKQQIENILRKRGVITMEGKFDKTVFRKRVTETWLYSKVVKYGFLKDEKESASVPGTITQEPELETFTEVKDVKLEYPSPLVGGGQEELEETDIQESKIEEPVNEQVPVEEPDDKEETNPEEIVEEPIEEEKVSEVVEDPAPAEEPVEEEKVSEVVEDPAPSDEDKTEEPKQPKKKSTKKK